MMNYAEIVYDDEEDKEDEIVNDIVNWYEESSRQ